MNRITQSLLVCGIAMSSLVSSAFADNTTYCDFVMGNKVFQVTAEGDFANGEAIVTNVSILQDGKQTSLKDIKKISIHDTLVYKSSEHGDGRVFSKYLNTTYAATLDLVTKKTLIGHYPPPGGPATFVKDLYGMCRESKLIQERDPSIPQPMFSPQQPH